MTLDRVQIDCRHMSNPIGVAVGRACSKKGLCINFKKSLLRSHPASVVDLYSSESARRQYLLCCKPVTSDTEDGSTECDIIMNKDELVTAFGDDEEPGMSLDDDEVPK